MTRKCEWNGPAGSIGRTTQVQDIQPRPWIRTDAADRSTPYQEVRDDIP